MRLVALEKTFPMVCLELSFTTGKFSPKIEKTKGNSLAFFFKMSCFGNSLREPITFV